MTATQSQIRDALLADGYAVGRDKHWWGENMWNHRETIRTILQSALDTQKPAGDVQTALDWLYEKATAGCTEFTDELPDNYRREKPMNKDITGGEVEALKLSLIEKLAGNIEDISRTPYDAEGKQSMAENIVRCAVQYLANDGHLKTTAHPQLATDSSCESLAKWMVHHGFTTGHGDTVDGLLNELSWQLSEKTTGEDVWRPISEAPRDGTRMLLIVDGKEIGYKSGTQARIIGYWAKQFTIEASDDCDPEKYPNLFDWSEDNGNYFAKPGFYVDTLENQYGDEIVKLVQPTHFMPLPAAPGGE